MSSPIVNQLFDMLEDYGASFLKILPEDDRGKSMGVIVVVREELTQSFLEFLEGWQTKPDKLDYDWDNK